MQFTPVHRIYYAKTWKGVVHQPVSVRSFNRTSQKDQKQHDISLGSGKWSEKAGFMSFTDILCLSVINPSQESDLKSQLKAAYRSYFALSLYSVPGDNCTCQASCEKLSVLAAWIFTGKQEPLPWERATVLRVQIPMLKWGPCSQGLPWRNGVSAAGWVVSSFRDVVCWAGPFLCTPVSFCSECKRISTLTSKFKQGKCAP